MSEETPALTATSDERVDRVTVAKAGEVSGWRSWCYLIWLSVQRQARAHLMVWIALGLLAFTTFVVMLNTSAGRWSMSHWRHPFRKGPAYADFLFTLEKVQNAVPLDAAGQAVMQAVNETFRIMLDQVSGFYVFSRWVVFSMFTTFLLPLWSLSFATEGLGREREARNLVWVLTRPLSRPAIYLAKYLAILPWCLALNVGGFAVLCAAGGEPGQRAFAVYWPAVVGGSFAFASIFHLMGTWFRRPAVAAILYSFFLETLMGNLPGHLKRFSVSFYIRCVMYDGARDLGIQPSRPAIFLPVSAPTAWLILAAVTLITLGVGMLIFTRREYLEVI
jgi:ABC-type transport system involved in multi-copper enzyme maturation permease subunit